MNAQYLRGLGFSLLSLTAIVFCSTAVLKYSEAVAQATSIAGVASVVDGDTIEIHGKRIRLSGFDSPESGSTCGSVNVYQQASLALADFIGTRTVHCEITGRDSFGRQTADCHVGSMDLGDYLVSLGWARDWPRYSGGRYADEEARARAEQLGIWGMECPADLWGNRDYTSRPVAPALASSISEVAYVTANVLNVRMGPSAQHPVVGRLHRRARVQVQERSAGWARIVASGTLTEGWVAEDFLSGAEPVQERRVQQQLGDAQVRRLIMEQSLSYYVGSCPCPYNVDRAGRRCGRRSAYSRPGGASPLCYPSDVSDAQVEAHRRRSNR